MKELTYLILVCFAFASCSKMDDSKTFAIDSPSNCSGQCFVLSGKIREKQSDAPLAGTEVKLYFKEPSIYVTTNEILLGTAITNSDGQYNFAFDNKKYGSTAGYFKLTASKTGYIFQNRGSATDNEIKTFLLDTASNAITNKQTMEDIYLYKSILFNIEVTALSGTNFTSLSITYGFGTGGYNFAVNGGSPFTKTYTLPTAVNLPTNIQWTINGNNSQIPSITRDTIVAIPGANNTYQIKL